MKLAGPADTEELREVLAACKDADLEVKFKVPKGSSYVEASRSLQIQLWATLRAFEIKVASDALEAKRRTTTEEALLAEVDGFEVESSKLQALGARDTKVYY